MAAVLSPQTVSTSPSPTSLPPRSSPSPNPNSNPNFSTLPPLITSPPPRATNLQRVSSFPKNRLSTFSTASAPHSRSRPQSTAFPIFLSSLNYALVRDFAYPHYHPLHYGPPPEAPSGTSTPASEAQRRLSDPAPTWEGSRGQWSTGPWGEEEMLPTSSFGDRDGPPWSEDEDLASPVVTSARHKKHKSNVVGFDHSRGRSREVQDLGRRGPYTGANGGGGGQAYYKSDPHESANAPGGEYITYPPGGSSYDQQPSSSSPLQIPAGDEASRRDSHFATTLPSRSYASHHPSSTTTPLSDAADDDDDADDFSDTSSSPGSPSPGSPSADNDDDDDDEHDPLSPFHGTDHYSSSRYSRDYQFTIASPDEEMHGKAVALFDFARENENELPLAEGQVILVSYRHGQGWLVAQDPKTGESGLVPEEYVRLLRDIEGGWGGLMNGSAAAAAGAGEVVVGSPIAGGEEKGAGEARTPTQAEQHRREQSASCGGGGGAAGGGKEAEYYPPVVSTFSTSSKDLEPWPQHLLGSQANTPVLGGDAFHRRASIEEQPGKGGGGSGGGGER